MSCISQPKQPLGWGSPCHVSTWILKGILAILILTIDQVSTDHRPSVDQLLTDTSVKYRRTIGEVSVKYRWTKSYIGRDTSGTTIDRVSTECRPTIVRVSTDYRSLYRPSVDRLSTECQQSVDRLSTAISTDRSVDTIYSKHDDKPAVIHSSCLFGAESYSGQRERKSVWQGFQYKSKIFELVFEKLPKCLYIHS